MALYPAIAATSQAICGLLQSAAADTPEFTTAGISLVTPTGLQKAPAEKMALTVCMYRVAVEQVRRNLTPRREPDGRLHRPPVPVNLHYLVTAWSTDAVTQQRLLGWAIRVLHNTSTLPAGLLNQFGPEETVFRSDETVELIFEGLSRQDTTDAWEQAQSNQQPSATYVARTIEIETDLEIHEYAPVQTREMRYAEVAAG